MSVRIQTGFVGIEYPLDHPRVGWQSHSGTVTATNAAAGFPAADALDPRTFNAWKPSAFPASWTLTFPSARVVSYVAVGAHTIGTSGANVQIEVPDGLGGWNLVAGTSDVPGDDGALMFLLSPASRTAIRVTVSDLGGASLPELGNIRVGPVMEWPQRAQFTGTPITEARQIEYEFNQSQTGEWLGQTVKRRGLAFDASISHLSEAWTASTYAPFRAYADTGNPFFYAARPVKYPDEVAYCMADGLIQSERATPNKAISRAVTMRLRGYARNG